MMGPMDPLMYQPTPHLLAIIFFVVFPLIYFFGRIVEFLLRQVVLSFKFLFLSLFEFFYRDDYEILLAPELERKRRRRERHRRAMQPGPQTDFSEGVPGVEVLRVHTNGGATLVPEAPVAENAVLEVAIDGGHKETAAIKEDHMHHSPTDDEDEEGCKNSKPVSIASEKETQVRHRKHHHPHHHQHQHRVGEAEDTATGTTCSR